MKIDVVITSFVRKDFPFSKEVVDLCVFHLDKIPSIETIHFVGTALPALYHSRVEFYEVEEESEYSQRSPPAIRAMDLVVSNPKVTNPLILCHIDEYLLEDPVLIAEKMIREDYVYAGSILRFNTKAQFPKDTLYLPYLSPIGMPIINPIKWRQLGCFMLDHQMISAHPELKEVEGWIPGSVYQKTNDEARLLTFYLHSKRVKVHFVEIKHKHFGTLGRYPRKLYDWTMTSSSPPGRAFSWSRIERRLVQFSSLYYEAFNQNPSLDFVIKAGIDPYR